MTGVAGPILEISEKQRKFSKKPISQRRKLPVVMGEETVSRSQTRLRMVRLHAVARAITAHRLAVGAMLQRGIPREAKSNSACD